MIDRFFHPWHTEEDEMKQEEEGSKARLESMEKTWEDESEGLINQGRVDESGTNS